ncbi:VanZ like family protein [Paenibacillus sp. P1XP2]|nr:VanZ like family protein [Paenibacillus sp. P1XP2]
MTNNCEMNDIISKITMPGPAQPIRIRPMRRSSWALSCCSSCTCTRSSKSSCSNSAASAAYYLREMVDHILHPGMIADRLRMASNLMPLREIEGYLRDLGDGVNFMNFFGNIAAFMPLGFLLPMVCGVRSMTLPKVLLISFGVSLALESLQLVLFIGTFDVDDIIMNTAGGLLGYAAYVVLYFLLKQGEQGRNRNQPF